MPTNKLELGSWDSGGKNPGFRFVSRKCPHDSVRGQDSGSTAWVVAPSKGALVEFDQVNFWPCWMPYFELRVIMRSPPDSSVCVSLLFSQKYGCSKFWNERCSWTCLLYLYPLTSSILERYWHSLNNHLQKQKQMYTPSSELPWMPESKVTSYGRSKGSIYWAPVPLEPPSKVTSDPGIQDNYACGDNAKKAVKKSHHLFIQDTCCHRHSSVQLFFDSLLICLLCRIYQSMD